MIKRPAFFLDVQRCTGCKTCILACRDKNNLGPGIRWRRVVEFSGGKWIKQTDGTLTQDVFAYYISVSCNHCQDPVCVTSCPTTAMNQDANGIVSVDPQKCVGCRYCQWVCPYAAPQYDPAIGQVSKCDFCRDEATNNGSPACVAACPTRALQFADYDSLFAVHGEAGMIAPLPPVEMTTPNILVKSSSAAKPLDTNSGLIANPEEVRDE